MPGRHIRLGSQAERRLSQLLPAYPSAGTGLAGRATSGIGVAGTQETLARPPCQELEPSASPPGSPCAAQVIGALDDAIILAAHGGFIAVGSRHVEELFGQMKGLLPLSGSRQ